MPMIRIALDDALLELADEVAKSQNVPRSELMREALRAHLKKLRYQELERQERAAYEGQPDELDEVHLWERFAVWPNR